MRFQMCSIQSTSLLSCNGLSTLRDEITCTLEAAQLGLLLICCATPYWSYAHNLYHYIQVQSVYGLSSGIDCHSPKL